MTITKSRKDRGEEVRDSVNAWFMWHSGRLPGITRQWLDQQAERTKARYIESGRFDEEARFWSLYSINTQLDRDDRIGKTPVLTLDAGILSEGEHIPPFLPEGFVDANFTVPNESQPLFKTENGQSALEHMLAAYRRLPNYLMYYYDLVMEAYNDLNERYLREVSFTYGTSLENVHWEGPELHGSGPLYPEETVSEIRQSNDLGMMKRLRAQVIFTGGTNTAMMKTAFRCTGTHTNKCEAVTYIMQDPYTDTMIEPSACSADESVGGCGKKRGEIQFTMLNKPDSVSITYQMIQVQDLDSDDGSPKTINVELRGSLCGEVIDGGFVTLDGILMTRPIGRGKKTREPYFFCTSIIENGKQRNVVVSEEDETIVRQWVNARDADQILSDLASNFAPIIHGHNTIKKAIIIQAVGGLRIEAQDKRGDIHILLLGDPGVAKSQLLNAAVKLTPGSLLYDCSQASQAGLVAAAEKKKDLFSSGESWAIQSGALALTPEHSVCALDEFHLLGSKDSSVIEALNVALESQEVRITKAAKGKVTTRVAVLAAANPKTRTARFDPDSPIPLWDQANVKFNTLSRLDYLGIIRDMEEEALDVSISEAMWDAADPTVQMLSDNVFPMDNFMPKLISLAKRINTVFISPEAKEYLINTYTEARQSALKDGKVTPRRNESLRRFAQAIARLCLSDTIQLEHAKMAESILRTSMTDTHPSIMDGGQTTKQEKLFDAILESFKDAELLPEHVERDALSINHVTRHLANDPKWPSNLDKPSKQVVGQALDQFKKEGLLQRRGNKEKGYVYRTA